MNTKEPKKPWMEEEDDDLDYSTITADKVNEITLKGEKYEPQNEAERQLKEEILEALEEGGSIEVPAND